MSSRKALCIAIAIGLWGAVVNSQTVGPANPLVRNCVPAEWQAADVRWSRDVAPHNKIDDLIDATSDPVVDIVVNFRRCIRQSDLDTLAQLSPESQLVMKGRFLSFASLSGVARSNVQTIASMPQVAFVERKLGFSGSLDVSVANIRVASAPGLIDTVEEQFEEIDGTGVNIAILDSGVDDPGGPGTTHGAFPNAVAYYDAVTADGVPRIPENNPDDDHGHGTHVASIALGRPVLTTTGPFPRGVAPDAGLIDVRVLNRTTNDCRSKSWDDTSNGLETIYKNRLDWEVKVVNMSIRQCDEAGKTIVSDGLDAFSQLIDLAEAMGIVMVAAAGNNGPTNVGLSSPAAATRAITVAASDDRNSTDRSQSVIAGFSNRGPRNPNGIVDLDDLKPEVTAPGENTSPTPPRPNGISAAKSDSLLDRRSVRGTSMAAPHVAGLAALILEQRPGMAPAAVEQLLIQTAERKGTPSRPDVDPEWSAEWGWGLVNGFAAIDMLQRESEHTDLTFPNHPAIPFWTSRDIFTRDPPKVNVPNEAGVQIENRGPNPARNVPVVFTVTNFSASTPSLSQIGTVRVPRINPGQKRVVSIPWTPTAATVCFEVQISYGLDTDYGNNIAQRNVAVAESPVTFEVRNTLTEEPREIRLVPTLDPPTSDWTVTITPPSITLAADDCPAEIEVLLDPLPSAPSGSMQRVDIAAMIDDVELGGVSVEAFAPTFPDCNSNGVDDAVDIGGGASQDINADGVPDECQIGSVLWRFFGTAQGGQVSATIDGFFATCTVTVTTVAGESAATVAANLAAAINADACLVSQEIAATASSEIVRITGFLISHQDVSTNVTDSGLAHEIPLLSIPTLSLLGLIVLAMLFIGVGIGVLWRRKTHSA